MTCFAAVLESIVGTKQTSTHVRPDVRFRG
jgi:hypothetical protein